MTAEVNGAVPRVLRAVVAVLLGVVLTALGVVLGVVESFLHPLRVLGVVPVGVVGAVVVNFAVVHLVGRGTRSRVFALVPAVGWLLTVIVLSVGRPEGDFVIPGTWVGYAYLIGGTIAAVVGVVLLPWYSLQDAAAGQRSQPPPPDS